MDSEISGIIPATFVPFTDTQEIHEDGFVDHLEWVAGHERVSGLLVNGHAGEQYALSRSERVRLVELAAELPGETPVYSGIMGARTGEVIREVEAVEEAGADAVMIDAPLTPIHGRREAALTFYTEIAEAADVPVVAFQTAKRTSRNFSSDLLAEIADIPNVVAIKEGVWDVDHTQDDVRAVRERAASVNFLMGNDEHLLPCYALGCDGTVAELAAAFPDLVADLYDAVHDGDMATARSVDARMQPVLDAVYQDPKHDSSIRLKVAMELRGLLPTSIPREPAVPIPDPEVEDVREALEAADLL